LAVLRPKSAWKLQPSRPLLGTLRPLSSAEVELNILPSGETELKIYHDLLKGVSPEMLYWWFTHIGGQMELNGKLYSRYQVWHPHDHIHWELVEVADDSKVGVGSKFYIVEAFARNMGYLINNLETVTRLDLTGITLNQFGAGRRFFSLAHDFIPETGGTRYISRMLVGFESGFGKSLLNQFIRWQIFPQPMGRAWLVHNIEEVSNFENFLPRLWEHEVETKSLESV
jgi:hypothetical protein